MFSSKKLVPNDVRHYFHNCRTTVPLCGSCENNEKPGETLFSQLEHNWNTTVELFSQLPKCDHIYASGHRASQRFLLYPNLNLPNLEKYQFYELHKTKYRKGST